MANKVERAFGELAKFYGLYLERNGSDHFTLRRPGKFSVWGSGTKRVDDALREAESAIRKQFRRHNVALPEGRFDGSARARASIGEIGSLGEILANAIETAPAPEQKQSGRGLVNNRGIVKLRGIIECQQDMVRRTAMDKLFVEVAKAHIDASIDVRRGILSEWTKSREFNLTPLDGELKDKLVNAVWRGTTGDNRFKRNAPKEGPVSTQEESTRRNRNFNHIQVGAVVRYLVENGTVVDDVYCYRSDFSDESAAKYLQEVTFKRQKDDKSFRGVTPELIGPDLIKRLRVEQFGKTAEEIATAERANNPAATLRADVDKLRETVRKLEQRIEDLEAISTAPKPNGHALHA